jgi:HSP20 family protein
LAEEVSDMLARWNPWQELYDMQRETSELARRFFGTGWLTPGSGRSHNGGAWNPAVDVFTRDGDLVIKAELPGIDPDKDVDISWQDGLLTIRGERRSEERTERENYYRWESSYGSFQRSVPIPDGVKFEDVQASYDRGVLEVVVPKAAELTAPKRVPITTGGERKALTTRGRKK